MSDFTFSAVNATDASNFCRLHDQVMRPQCEERGWKWDQAFEDLQNKQFFEMPGLRRIEFKGKTIGFVGFHAETDQMILSRFYLEPNLQQQGIGTKILNALFSEKGIDQKRIRLRVLNKSRACALYERLGFVSYKVPDEIFAYYERVPNPAPNPAPDPAPDPA